MAFQVVCDFAIPFEMMSNNFEHQGQLIESKKKKKKILKYNSNIDSFFKKPESQMLCFESM